MTHGVHNPFLTFLFLLAAIMAGSIAAAQRRANSSRRSLELKLLADRLGFAGFDPGPNEKFLLGWDFLGWFSHGENRYAFNILEGTYHDQKLFVFDYHYQTGSGKDEDHRYDTILMLIVPEAFPKLTIQPQDTLGRIEGAFDAANIKFESAEFSKIYRVHCQDKKFGYDVCNPQMIDYLLSNRGLGIEIQGPVISLAFKGQLPVAEIEVELQRIAQIRALLPDYLFKQTSN